MSKHLGSTIAIGFATAALCGCAGLGRVVQGAAGIIAPEYKASFDNVYGLLLQDQLLASLELEAVLITRDGRILRKDDLRPTVLSTQQAYAWDALPKGFIPLFLGNAERLPPEQAEQRKALADALKAVPATPATEPKQKESKP